MVTAYGCDPMTVDEDFLLSKRQYEHSTGRRQKRDVIAYQIRQSFKPGEVTPEQANQIGYELALRFTKSKHAFIVATHTDRAHIHNHIVFNSTTLDGSRKFQNFFLSYLAVQKTSDRLCVQNGLSIIDTKPYRERQKRTAYPQKPSFRDTICASIDAALQQKPGDFEALLRLLEEDGYEVKQSKYVAVRGKGQQLLIDIESKLAAGKGDGYARWAKSFNLKQMAEAVCYIKEHQVGSYDELAEQADAAVARFDALSNSIKASEQRLVEIAALKKHILNYARTREVYASYRKSGYSKKFLEEHREEITLHRAAKEAFDRLPASDVMGKQKSRVPTIRELNQEYAQVLSAKKKAYADYRTARREMQDLLIARKNIEMILELDHDVDKQHRQREQQNQDR